MATMNLWGIDPQTRMPKLFAFAMPQGDMNEVEAQARNEGWTRLQWGIASPSMDTPISEEESQKDPSPSTD